MRTLRQWLPYLDLWLDVGFLDIRTELMHESYHEMYRVYIAVGVRLFRRWGWRFRLYSPVY